MDLFESWRESVKNEMIDEKVFLNELRIKDCEEFQSKAKAMHELTFEEIDCLDCANCCKTTVAILEKSDIKRIAKHLKMPPKVFQKKFTLEDINGELSFRKVPCVFLEADNKCAIYEVRPVACKDYPHTGSGDFLKRKKLHIQNLDICPAVHSVILKIKDMDQM